jgi:transcriptional regulator with XRE-family HTH domain
MPQLFGEKLRLLRRRNGLTQSDLAQQLGLASHAHIAKLESNQDVPSLALVVQIAARLHASTDYLLRDTIPAAELPTHERGQPVTPSTQSRRLGENLRVLRRGHGLTQADLARRLGLARQGYISNLEVGRKLPSLDIVVQIADLFEVTTDYLLRETPAAAASGAHATGEA